ncbi:TIR domain-containing protein [Neorhizobium alkalisoli]|uniref:Putative nucleotide-binding protein with TIR-like domain n=1 Tax=Neorhizobium alkalisoli TaxID=528178 RepID=A0A561QS43_9HYPH|nr:TIR domain-containing protein [Neorhizobium alkalisoli]TWF53159.1 putative nucleotide-binding protein with TIR-like domain [Neorhizobium alkalisoli]
MAKPIVFIGSSSEHRNLALYIQSAMQYDVAPVVWTQGTFEPSHFTLESLESALDKADFAILVCAPDDVTVSRNKEYSTVRDNVIFELGLFIGRLGRKRTFLVSPRGVDLHLPSDLSGLTPETFDPDELLNPEAALGPACTKIKAAIVKAGRLPRSDFSEAREGMAEERSLDRSDELQHTPQSTWSDEKFEFEFFIATMHENEKRVSEIEDAYRTSALNTSQEKLAEWDTRCEYARIISGKGGNLSLIRDKSEAFPMNAEIRKTLAQALQHYGDDLGALQEFIIAVDIANDAQIAANISKRGVEVAKKVKNSSALKTFKEKLISFPIKNHRDKSEIMEAFRILVEAAKLPEIHKALGELITAMKPDDIDARFASAHAYSEADQDGLSMLQYEAIPPEERSGMAWNNLGVSYDRLGLKSKAIGAFEIAASKGETIADGNLARKLTFGGFHIEARKRADSAILKPSPHESVCSIAAEIREQKEDEELRYSAARERALEQRKERTAIGEAALVQIGADIDGYWDTEFGQIQLISDEDGNYSASTHVTHQVKSIGFGILKPSRNMIERRNIRIALKRFGNALEGTITREAGDSPATLLGAIDLEHHLLLAISVDGQTISGIEFGYQEARVNWRRSTSLQITEQTQSET